MKRAIIREIMNTEAYLKLLANSPIRVSVICVSYGVMVKLKMINPIDTLNESEKRDIWEEAKRLCANNNKEYIIQVSKALYTMG